MTFKHWKELIIIVAILFIIGASKEQSLIQIEEEKTLEPRVNKCGSSTFGLPQNPERSCIVYGFARPQHCVLFPPKEYSGTINREAITSKPVQFCCIRDGTCYW